MKRILITAGATSEPIDAVRSITNNATGKLGSYIADYAVKQGIEVHYVSGANACQPTQAVKHYVTTGVDSVLGVLDQLMMRYQYDAVIHSMAISDYRVAATAHYQGSNLTEIVAQDAYQKLPSSNDHLAILLEPSPKVIGYIKKKQPDTRLVGFKLLSQVSVDTLVRVAQNLMIKNDCSFVVANDAADISGDQHRGYIVDEKGIMKQYETKETLAQGILQEVQNLWIKNQ